MPELGIGLGISKGVTPKSKLLLDKYDIDVAFSLRKVRADYNGPCVRVRNNAGTLKDIGFTSSGVLDEDALNAHCKSNDGTVQTWYNQSTEGGHFNAVQDTAADQPIIYDASEGGYLGYVENTGNRYLRFENQLTGVTDAAVVYENTTSPGGVGVSAYVVGEHETSGTGGNGILVGHNTVNGFSFVPDSGLSVVTRTGEGQNDKHAGFVYTGGSDKFAVVDGYVCGESSNAGSANFDYIFTKSKNGTDQDDHDFVGKIWEVFLSTSDLSANRIVLENSILSANGLTVPEQTLLEKYSAGAVAYSLRCVNREYVGPVVEVLGAQTTPVSEDVYLDSTGVVNKSRITELCTDDEDSNALVYGYIKKWYDQGGGGVTATNTGANNTKPVIHDSTDGVVLSNGEPAILFNDADVVLTTGTIPNNSGTTFVVYSPKEHANTNANHMFAREASAGTDWFLTAANADTTNKVLQPAMTEGVTTIRISGAETITTPSSGRDTLYDSTLGKQSLVFVDSWAVPNTSWAISDYSTDGSYDIEGHVQEWIWWEDSIKDSINDIEKSVNKHYLTFQEVDTTSGFVSNSAYNVKLAHGVRKLSDSLLCCKIERSSDNATKNIGWGSDGFVDTEAIKDFCGSSNGKVLTVYDQSGQGYHAYRDNDASWPGSLWIYDGTDIYTSNGRPAFYQKDESTDTRYRYDISGSNSGSQGNRYSYTDQTKASFSTVCGPVTENSDAVGDGGKLFTTADFTVYRNDSQRLRADIFDSGEGLAPSMTTDEAITRQRVVMSGGTLGGTVWGHIDDSEDNDNVDNPAGWLGNPQNHRVDIFFQTNSEQADQAYLQETIFYDNDFRVEGTLESLKAEINDAFDVFASDETPTSGFLNEFSGAAAAYSVRKLGDSPVCMRVRKTVSSVDYYQVIGFDSNGDLDTAAIEEFGGSNDVFVQTWYDQSGNGNHQVQDTNAGQPKIYDGTDGIVYENGRPALEFDGTDDEFDDVTLSASVNQNDLGLFAVGRQDESSPSFSTLCNLRTSTDDAFALGYRTTQFIYNDNVLGTFTALDLTQRIWSGYADSSSDEVKFYLDSNEEVSTTAVSEDHLTFTIAGLGHVEASTRWNGFVQEILLYDSSTKSNHSLIESNINNYFLVHQSASTTPATGLLSEAPGAKVAFSTRQLGDALLCMKVVSDATGNPTKNIGFKNGELDTAAIEEFCGTNIGRVETWYDQSGNGNDLTPIENDRAWVNTSGTATAFGDSVGNGDKPIIFMPDGKASAATYQFSQGFVRIGGKPAIKFRNRLMATESLGDQLRAAFSVLKHSGSNSQFVYYLNPYAYLAVSGPSDANFQHEGYSTQNARGHIGGNGSFIDQEFSHSSLYVGVTNDSLEINNKDVIISHIGDEPTNASTSDFMVMGGRFVDSNAVNASQPVVAEFIGYTDSVDFDDTRDIVETNMNSRHKIFKKFSTGLLDQYPGAVGAYSLRRLSSTYTGPLIRVRDTESGSTEYDIYPNGEGDLEINQIYIASANRHQDANSGVSVVKWYDQSGNGNDLTVDLANAPQIKVSGERVSRDGLRPAVVFDSSSYLSSEVITNTGEATAYVVANSDDTAANKVTFFVPEVFAFLTNAEVLQLYSGITSDDGGATTTIETNDTLVRNLTFFGNDGSTTFGGVNGQAFVTSANVPNSASGYDRIKIGANATNTINFDGKIQEAVYYNSDQRSVRAGIEKNVNEYYEVYDKQLLLDVVEDAAAAYSLRKLRAGYTGPAINVYNGTDYKDIYFKADGTLDTGAISRFCGSNDGTVAIWYDQSGNNNHAKQSSASQRPKVYDGTTGYVDGVEFNGSDNTNIRLEDYTFDMTNVSALLVAQSSDDTNNQTIIDAHETTTAREFTLGINNGSVRTTILYDGNESRASDDIAAFDDLFLVTMFADSTTSNDSYIDGVLATGTSGPPTTPNTTDNICIGQRGSGSSDFTGKVLEFVVYFSDQSSNRIVAESNINRYYSIY